MRWIKKKALEAAERSERERERQYERYMVEGVSGIKEERTRAQWRRRQKKVEEEEKAEEGVRRASSCSIPLKRERNLCVRA